jgi:hypothetical protein
MTPRQELGNQNLLNLGTGRSLPKSSSGGSSLKFSRIRDRTCEWFNPCNLGDRQQKCSETYPSGRTITTLDDSSHRAVYLNGVLGLETEYVTFATYDWAGAGISSVALANGIGYSYTYSQRGQLEEPDAWCVGVQLWHAAVSAYSRYIVFLGANASQTGNNNGNLHSQTASYPRAPAAGVSFAQACAYDSVNRRR